MTNNSEVKMEVDEVKKDEAKTDKDLKAIIAEGCCS